MADDPRWAEVDDYIGASLLPNDPVLDAALAASTAANLPAIQVSPTQGQFLFLFARALRAQRILELGTLGGYSTICLARAGGRVTTLEVSPEHAAVATKNIARAGVAERVDVIVGPALATMRTLSGPFDLIFIDADKESYPEYLTASVALSRPGTVIIADNVVREGEVANPTSDDPRVRAVRQFIDRVAKDPRLSATVLQTVGSKGYDGFALITVR
jgi:predicted O-methyltransferase YrrM